MNLWDNKTSKVMIKIIPILIIIALIVQFAMVSASNNTNNSGINISLNATDITMIIDISETNVSEHIQNLTPLNETEINISEPINDANISKPIKKTISKNITINLKNKQGLRIGNKKGLKWVIRFEYKV